MKMIINSPTYGNHTVFFDDEDIDLIKKYRWSIWRSATGKFYAFHSWKRSGEEVSIKMHRLVMGVEREKYPLIDHCDGNTLNNKKVNLRKAVHSQNSMNRGKTIKNKSGFKGVSKKTKNRYQVVVVVKGKRHYGGLFENPIDAAKKYDEMAKKHHGEFAYLNFPSLKIEKPKLNDKIYVQPLGDRKRENSTGFRGVNPYNNTGKYKAYIQVNKKMMVLGIFDNPLDAAKEYDKAAKKYKGNRATLNFPTS